MEDILKEIKFGPDGLVPVITQDNRTDIVLMLAYMNSEALQKSLETGLVHYWSRSRQKLWLKGETSGHYQHIKAIKLDCDGDTLLIKVKQDVAACHTGNFSCFYRDIEANNTNMSGMTATDSPSSSKSDSSVLNELYDVIADRLVHPKEGSYTNYLFEKGLDKILKKVGEEASEVIIAAKNEAPDEIKYEVADLIYHLFVLLAQRGLKPEDIYGELLKRR